MQRSSLFALAFVAALTLPSVVCAEPPAGATQLTAEAQQDGSISVHWQPVSEDIQSYRVYYSQKSILENDGYYDDVETTEGPVTDFVLRGVPASLTTVYVSVMAVNAAGEESAYFAEEVKVERTPTAPADEPAPPPPAPEVSAPVAEPSTSLKLLSAQSLSATQVQLKFSVRPVIAPASAPQAFAIVDGTGNPLPIEQMTIDGTQATIQTARQVAGAVYRLRLSEPLTGEGNLPLDTIDRTSFFTGHATGLLALESVQTPAGAPQPAVQQNFALPDVVNFTLTAELQKNKLFTVIGQWEYDPSVPESAFLVVRQSRDGGRTFGPAEYLPRTLDGVRIPDVTPENFGLSVTVADATGGSSSGVFKSVFAWNTPVVAPPVAPVVQPSAPTATVTAPKTVMTAPQTPKVKNLSQTGVGTLSSLALVGAAIGWRRARKFKKA